jgi:hypothetical protein
MLKRYHHIVGGVFRVVDASVIGVTWIISYWIRFKIQVFAVTKGFPSFQIYASLTPLVMVDHFFLAEGVSISSHVAQNRRGACALTGTRRGNGFFHHAHLSF